LGGPNQRILGTEPPDHALNSFRRVLRISLVNEAQLKFAHAEIHTFVQASKRHCRRACCCSGRRSATRLSSCQPSCGQAMLSRSYIYRHAWARACHQTWL